MLDTFLNGLESCFDFFVFVVQKSWILYTTAPVLMAVLALFLIRKVLDIFKILKG